jgi:2-oxoglutarate dehydrogenase E2 component (dihydrolipoamide succinyltransferase)
MGGKRVEVRVPDLGDAGRVTVIEWLRGVGERVRAGDDLVEIETEKTTFIVPSPADGVLSEVRAERGRSVAVGETIGSLDA